MEAFLTFVFAVGLLLGVVALEAWFAMVLWNFVAAHFGLPTVTFWVAAAVLFLVNMIKPSVRVNKETA